MKLTEREFDALYRRMMPKIFRRVFLELGDEDEARDVVQSVFMTLWKEREGIANPEAFLNWRASAEMNDFFRHKSVLERFARLYPIELKMLSLSDDRPVEAVRRFIESELTEAVRRVVECVFYQRLSYKATAEKLQISVATVNKHVVNALHTMREHFNKNYQTFES